MRALRSVLSRLGRYVVALFLLVFARRRSKAGSNEGHTERRIGAAGRTELAVAALLVLSALAAAAFVVVYVVDIDTQLLGLGIGIAFLLLSAAAIVASKALVPQEERVEERPAFSHPDGGDRREAAELDELVASGAQGISRRRLLGAAAGAAGAALGAAAVVPIASLGPAVDNRLRENPWRDGVRLVDENGVSVPASRLEVGSFLTAFAEGASPDDFSSSVVVVRVDPRALELPPERADWAPRGILAYSKICTHAACAINLYRKPLYPPQAPGPALVCPCHYSTFDVLRAAKVIFGPAGRPLPQLPLAIDDRGHLIAAGPLSGNVGPAWSGVRES